MTHFKLPSGGDTNLKSYFLVSMIARDDGAVLAGKCKQWQVSRNLMLFCAENRTSES